MEVTIKQQRDGERKVQLTVRIPERLKLELLQLSRQRNESLALTVSQCLRLGIEALKQAG